MKDSNIPFHAFRFSNVSTRTGGPLKPGFGLSGDVQISSILSSRPEQITARAVICGVEGPCV
jgi:hypothetical protein